MNNSQDEMLSPTENILCPFLHYPNFFPRSHGIGNIDKATTRNKAAI